MILTKVDPELRIMPFGSSSSFIVRHLHCINLRWFLRHACRAYDYSPVWVNQMNCFRIDSENMQLICPIHSFYLPFIYCSVTVSLSSALPQPLDLLSKTVLVLHCLILVVVSSTKSQRDQISTLVTQIHRCTLFAKRLARYSPFLLLWPDSGFQNYDREVLTNFHISHHFPHSPCS